MHWVAADTLKPKKTLTDGDNMSIAPKAGLVAVNVRKRPYSIKVFDMSSGEEKASIAYDSRQSVGGFGLSPDGKRLALLHARKTDKNEKKVPWKEIPKDPFPLKRPTRPTTPCRVTAFRHSLIPARRLFVC